METEISQSRCSFSIQRSGQDNYSVSEGEGVLHSILITAAIPARTGDKKAVQFISAEEAARLVPDNTTLWVEGSSG